MALSPHETPLAARFPGIGKFIESIRLTWVIETAMRLRLRGSPRDSARPMWGANNAANAKRARFDALVAPHTATLDILAWRFCRDRAAAADLVQDTLERAWRRFESLQDTQRARAWLIQIMRHLWLDRLRRRRTEVPIDEVAEPAMATPEAPSAWEHVTLDDIHRAIQQLREPFRAVAVLHDVDGLSYREIAARLDIPYNTAATRLHRAHQELKKLVLGLRAREEEP
jgi:RNA polymerase sigma-70 factor (ECF subfamily)